MNLRFQALLTACLVTAAFAQPFVGSWFAPNGEFRGCLINPGLLCPQTSFGPSEQERALHQESYSAMKVEQAGVYELSDSSGSVSDDDHQK